MIQLRKSESRGHFNHGWLDTYHSFSFADYYDPNYMGFRSLRVINEDKIAANRGFPLHGHQNMEILTYIIQGQLDHKDTLGNQATIHPGEVQRMSAGTGIRHSESNPASQETHLLQIWILPDKEGYPPSYEQKSHENKLKNQNFLLVASGDGREGTVSLHADISLYVGKFAKNKKHVQAIPKNRHAWIQLISGELSIGKQTLLAGDGAAISEESEIHLQSLEESEFLFFDLN